MITLIVVAGMLAPLSAIPPAYQGSWTTDLTACGREDTRGVQIDAHAVTFYEARGTVVSASQGSKGASARVDFVGEGGRWSEAIRLRKLSGNRMELLALGQTQTFSRCPVRAGT